MEINGGWRLVTNVGENAGQSVFHLHFHVLGGRAMNSSNKIDSLTGRESKLLEEFLRAIQMMRQDFNGRVLTIRRNDLRLLSLLLHQGEEDFSRRLSDLGVTTA